MEKMMSKEKKGGPKRGLWKAEEDLILKNYVEIHGEGNWATVSKRSGLKRGGKSCRLRWKNYLRPKIKRGEMSKEEEDLIIRMHNLLGNRWSLIAGRLPGRTDNEVKNYWNTHLNKKTTPPPPPTTVLGKRKSIDFDSNNDRHFAHLHSGDNNNDDNVNVNEDRDSNQSTESAGNSEVPIILSPKTTDDEAGSMEEEVVADNATWMEPAVQCFNYDYDYYDLETPFMMMTVNLNPSNLVFDEQPFTPCLDSFVLFEAFGTDSDVGTQPFLP